VAQQLKDAGLSWKPAVGDRFAIPDRDLDDELFVLSNMTIQVYNLPEGRVIGFNGTTEWALDDVEIEEAIWLPREDQLASCSVGRSGRCAGSTPVTRLRCICWEVHGPSWPERPRRRTPPRCWTCSTPPTPPQPDSGPPVSP
jgi:hypothetical protein